MKKSGDPFGRPATKGRAAGKSQASKTGRGSKLSTLTSSATDEDFYSSLAEMVGDNFDDDDEDESMTELDAKNLANTLAGMDDLDSDLFGDSLGRKSSTKNVSNTKPTTPSKSKLSNPTTPGKQDKTEMRGDSTRKTAEKRGDSSSPSGKKFSLNRFNNLDFDEDDPLAGLLSDDEDTATKSKAKKKTATAKKTTAKKEPEPVVESTERPRTSRNRQQQESQPLDFQSPPLSPENKTQNRQETMSPKFNDRFSSATESQDGSSATPTRLKGRQSPSKPKNDLSFESGDDLLPGIDQSPRQTPSSRQSTEQMPSNRQTSGTSARRREHKADSDLFGDDDGLLGLDEGKTTAKKTDTKASRFDELLGGKKEKNETKQQKPKTLDDFMSSISSGKKSTETQPRKAPSTKDEEESFQFGGYMPSAVSVGPGRPGSRPDTAPGRRSVRFADELGLDDDLLGGVSRPSTAPTERKQAAQGRQRGLKDSQGSSFEENFTQKEPNKKEARAGSDWLGLSSEDPGLELELLSYKPPTPSKTITKKPPQTEDAGVQQKPSPQDSPRRRNRGGQGDGDGDDFLKMLGITPDDKTTKSPLDGGPRRGKRWHDQASDEGDPLDLSSSYTGEMKPSSMAQQKMQPLDSSEVTSRSDSPGRNQVVHDQRLDTAKTTTLPQGLCDQRLETSRTSMIPEREQEAPKSIHQGVHDLTPDVTSRRALPSHKDNLNPHFQSSQHPPQTLISTPSTPYPQQGQHQLTNHIQVQASQGQPITPSQYHSTPTYIPQGSQFIAGDKAQLESEMHKLMKRIHEMEGNAQRHQIDGAGYVAQLEAKVRRLEMEIAHLQTTLDSVQTRHQTEMANIDTSNKAHIKTLEESYQSRETHIKEETDSQVAHFKDRLRALEEEKSTMQAAHLRKVQSLESSRNSELDKLKELHRNGIQEIRQEHEEEMAHLRKLKEQEVSAATSAHGHTKSLQSLMQQVLTSTKDVSDMRSQIEATHKSNITERELAAKARDEYLTQLQERLAKQQAENDEERARLQGLIAKMEVHMREQTRQVDQERWRLTQEESRIKALQSTLEDERRITMEQLAIERADVQRAREELLREQKRVTTELQEERRNISMERARLSSAHKEILTREKYKTDTTIQAEAELEITASKIKEDAAALGVRQAQLKQEEEALGRGKRDFHSRLEKFEEEKDRIGKLSLEVQRKSEEIGKLFAENARAREEGEEALVRAETLRRETENERAELETRFLLIQEKEKQLAQDRVSIAHERRVLEMDKRNGRCRQCEANTTGSTRLITDLPDGRVSSTPVISALDFDGPSQSPGRTLGTPDILLNSLELKRNLRKWTNEKEKDEEFLEQESKFLNQLRGSRGSTKKRLSMTS